MKSTTTHLDEIESQVIYIGNSLERLHKKIDQMVIQRKIGELNKEAELGEYVIVTTTGMNEQGYYELIHYIRAVIYRLESYSIERSPTKTMYTADYAFRHDSRGYAVIKDRSGELEAL